MSKPRQNKPLLTKKNIALPIVLALAFACLTGCADKWEYKVVSVSSESHDRTGTDGGKFSSITPDEEALNQLGGEGWELASSYLEMETAWVNFGDNSYVTGLQPNIRPQRVVFVFKRKL
jgi:hypothetical protein